MAFTGNEGTFITLEVGSVMTEVYRSHFLSGNAERKAIFFGKEKLQAIIDQMDCKGIRCYFGAEEMSQNGETWYELKLVMVGAKADESDMIGMNDKILDYGAPCPTQCDTASPLNGALSAM